MQVSVREIAAFLGGAAVGYFLHKPINRLLRKGQSQSSEPVETHGYVSPPGPRDPVKETRNLWGPQRDYIPELANAPDYDAVVAEGVRQDVS